MWNKFRMFALLASCVTASLKADPGSEPPKLLYLTQGGDPWHDYAWQAAKFQTTLPLWTEVSITAVGVGDKKAAWNTLKNPNFADGYDLLVYNACFAYATDFQVIDNIQRQARELGIPVILLHCALHNFRSTSPSLGPLADVLSAWDKWKWKDKDLLPVWSSFTGMDSLIHEPLSTLSLQKVKDHPITDGLPEQVSIEQDELYLARSQSADSIPLYLGETAKENPQPVIWIRKEGKTEVVGITLGHDQKTWEDDFFWQVLSQSVRYLTRSKPKLSDDTPVPL